MKVTDPTYHLKKDGLYWLQEVPDSNFNSGCGIDCDDFSKSERELVCKCLNDYSNDLQRAKDNAIKVGNEEFIEQHLVKKEKCYCPCHVNKGIKHVIECCNDGFIEVPLLFDTLYTLQGSFEVERQYFYKDADDNWFVISEAFYVVMNNNKHNWEKNGVYGTRELAFFSLLESKPKEESQEYILCAANWYDDGKEHIHQPKNISTGFVVCGRRHHNIINTLAQAFGHDSNHCEQGFITNTDRFVNRKEAYKIAFTADQIKGPNKGRNENSIGLTSEDLY